jgi:hypothetical protein
MCERAPLGVGYLAVSDLADSFLADGFLADTEQMGNLPAI